MPTQKLWFLTSELNFVFQRDKALMPLLFW